MFSAISSVAAGVADKVAGLFGGEQVKPLLDAKTTLEELQESLSEPQSQMEKLADTLKGGLQMDVIDSAKQQFETLTSGLSDMINGDAKKLLPPGAACFAGRWASSIKAKLGKIAKELERLVGSTTQASKKALSEVDGMRSTTDTAKESFRGVADLLAESASTIQDSVGNLEKMKGLSSSIVALEIRFSNSVAVARGSIDGITGSVASVPGTIITTIEQLIGELDTFKMRTPQKVMAAFKPPPPCCCCTPGKIGEAQEQLEGSLESVSSKVSLDSFLEGARKLKSTLEGLDLRPASAALDQIEAQVKPLLETVKGAARALSGSSAEGDDDALIRAEIERRGQEEQAREEATRREEEDQAEAMRQEEEAQASALRGTADAAADTAPPKAEAPEAEAPEAAEAEGGGEGGGDD